MSSDPASMLKQPTSSLTIKIIHRPLSKSQNKEKLHFTTLYNQGGIMESCKLIHCIPHSIRYPNHPQKLSDQIKSNKN